MPGPGLDPLVGHVGAGPEIDDEVDVKVQAGQRDQVVEPLRDDGVLRRAQLPVAGQVLDEAVPGAERRRKQTLSFLGAVLSRYFYFFFSFRTDAKYLN